MSVLKRITQLEQCVVSVEDRKRPGVVCFWSLTSAFRMSSEINQLCLEALSPLAEQCAKNQEKDTPLFIATRHFLKVQHTASWAACFKSYMVCARRWLSDHTNNMSLKNIGSHVDAMNCKIHV